MLAYVDESGCTGMKIGSGSSAVFSVIVVLFQERSEATRCYDHIEGLKQTLGIKKEFHFSKCSHEHQVRFLRECEQFDFVYFGVIVDKTRLANNSMSFNKPFLQYPVRTTFAEHADFLTNATVTIDRTGSSDFRKFLHKGLKDDLNGQHGRTVIKKVKSQQSHAHNLLQLADMVCGAVARSFHPTRKNQNIYRDIIRHKELTLAQWP